MISVKYYLTFGVKKNVICEKGFFAMYGITKKRIERVLKLLSNNEVSRDMRGKNVSNSFSSALVADINEHIASFPYKIAHYTTKEYRYLSSTLNVKIMYDLFKNTFPNHKVCNASYFKENFDLKFGQPQTDACTTCEELGVKIKSNELCESVKRSAAAELLVHIRRSLKFYEALKNSKTLDDQSQAICIDFMANVSLPVQDLYYYRKLTVSTFGIHDMKSGKMTCFVYHEGEDGNGANDVCSHLIFYIN